MGDAVIKVNGEYITACPHDDAVNILRNAGDIVVLTVKHYRAATPFLQKQRMSGRIIHTHLLCMVARISKWLGRTTTKDGGGGGGSVGGLGKHFRVALLLVSSSPIWSHHLWLFSSPTALLLPRRVAD